MVSEQKKAWVFLGIFALLIFAGIAVKRVWHHPEFMMMFHLPAAVFLALAGRGFSADLKRRYQEQVRQMNAAR